MTHSLQLHLFLARVERRDDKPGRRLLRGVRHAVGVQRSPHHRRHQEVAGFHASLVDHQRWLDRHLSCEFYNKSFILILKELS